MSISPEKAASSATGFRSTVNTVRNEKKWVSPFRQNQNASAAATTLTQSSTTVEKGAVESPKPKEDSHTAAAVSIKKEPEANGIPTNSKKVIVEPIIDLGGGLKMPESKILAIAKERLSKDLQTIDDKASEQKRLKELKHQKKLELEALKDQNKVNSRFAKFKRKLDFEKNKFSNDHQQKVAELESAIASYDKQIADFDKKTHDEIDAHQKDHEEKSTAADEKLAKDKETTILDGDTKEKEHLDTIHSHVISQKRAEISSRVLHAQRSEYELKLELLQLQLAQNEREVVKQQGVTSEHAAVKEDLENKVKDLKNAIAENDAAIAKSKESDSATEASLKASEEELESSRARVQELKQKLMEVRAGASDRATRLVDAKKKRLEYDEEQERLRVEEEERKRKEEEERKKREEEERIAREKKEEEEARVAQIKAAEEAKIATEKKAEDDRVAKKHAEEAAEVAALQKAREDENAKTALVNEQAEQTAKSFEQGKAASSAVEKSSEPSQTQSSKVPAIAATAALSGTVAAASSAGTAEAPSKFVTPIAKDAASSSETPKASKEESKKRRVSGFFSVFRRKDKDADVEEASKTSKSKSKSKAPLAAAGAVVAGATAVAATGAVIAGSTGHKAAAGTVNAVTSATGSLPVSKSTEAAIAREAQTATEALTPVLTPDSEEITASRTIKPPVTESVVAPVTQTAGTTEVSGTEIIDKELAGPPLALDNIHGAEIKPGAVEEGSVPAVAITSQTLDVSLEENSSQKVRKDDDALHAVTGTVPTDNAKTNSEVSNTVLTSLLTPPTTAPQETDEGLSLPSMSENKEALLNQTESSNVAPQISASSNSTKELSSREVTPEPVAGTGKNAKKNAKKRAAKKKKKAAAAAATVLPASNTAALDVANGTTVDASSEGQSEPVQSESVATQEAKSAIIAPTQEESEIGYIESKPVEIPDDQKFFPVEDVSPVSHAQELTRDASEPENHASISASGENILLETAGVSSATDAGISAVDGSLSENKDDSFPTLDPKVAGKVEPTSQPEVKNEASTHVPEKPTGAKIPPSSPSSEKKGFFKRFLSHPSKPSSSTSPNATPATTPKISSSVADATATTASGTATAMSKSTELTSKSTAADYENDSLYSYREVIVEEEVEI